MADPCQPVPYAARAALPWRRRTAHHIVRTARPLDEGHDPARHAGHAPVHRQPPADSGCGTSPAELHRRFADMPPPPPVPPVGWSVAPWLIGGGLGGAGVAGGAGLLARGIGNAVGHASSVLVPEPPGLLVFALAVLALAAVRAGRKAVVVSGAKAHGC